MAAENPALVLVDTGVVADAPASFLRWGIGDSISTPFEVEACRTAGGTTIHGVETAGTAAPLAEAVYENIAEHGADALAAVERGEVTPAVETIVETVHLTSVLAWENGGLAGAHALESGLRLSGITDPPHGPLVALCTLASAVWQDHPKTDYLAALLASMGFEDPLPPGADLEAGAEMAGATGMLQNEPREVSPELAVESLETARELLADAAA
jgi:glycerol dehydrogenase